MTAPYFDKNKTLHLIAYIAEKLGNVDFHTLFKILYFADQNHLAKYGFPILGDQYVAMKNGPVPSRTYDLVKADNCKGAFEVIPRYFIKTNIKADTELFSATELECLDASITKNGNKNFNTLTNESHDIAWEKADANNNIDVLEMARCGGANDAMLLLIKENLENEQLLF